MSANLQVNNTNLDEFINDSFKVTPSSLNSNKTNDTLLLSSSSSANNTTAISNMNASTSLTSLPSNSNGSLIVTNHTDQLQQRPKQQQIHNDNELIELLEYTSKFNLENGTLNTSLQEHQVYDQTSKSKVDLIVEGKTINKPKWWNENNLLTFDTQKENDECDSSIKCFTANHNQTPSLETSSFFKQSNNSIESSQNSNFYSKCNHRTI